MLGDNLFENLDITNFDVKELINNNPSIASDQHANYKISLNPSQNLGLPTNTTGGNIGIFINGVSLFDYRDGVAWDNNCLLYTSPSPRDRG